MIRPLSIICAALANALAASLFVTIAAAQDVTTDIGTLDKATAEKAFAAKPPSGSITARICTRSGSCCGSRSPAASSGTAPT